MPAGAIYAQKWLMKLKLSSRKHGLLKSCFLNVDEIYSRLLELRMSANAVRSGFRRHGVGRNLVEKVIENCRKMKSDKLILSTTNTRQNARRLYLSLGFAEAKTNRTPIGLIQYLPKIFTGVYTIRYDLMIGDF